MRGFGRAHGSRGRRQSHQVQLLRAGGNLPRHCRQLSGANPRPRGSEGAERGAVSGSGARHCPGGRQRPGGRAERLPGRASGRDPAEARGSCARPVIACQPVAGTCEVRRFKPRVSPGFPDALSCTEAGPGLTHRPQCCCRRRRESLESAFRELRDPPSMAGRLRPVSRARNEAEAAGLGLVAVWLVIDRPWTLGPALARPARCRWVLDRSSRPTGSGFGRTNRGAGRCASSRRSRTRCRKPRC